MYNCNQQSVEVPDLTKLRIETPRQACYFTLGFIAGRPGGMKILKAVGLDNEPIYLEDDTAWFIIGFATAERMPQYSADGLNIVRKERSYINV